MKLRNFELMEHRNRGPADKAGAIVRYLQQVKDQCRSLYEQRGKAFGEGRGIAGRLAIKQRREKPKFSDYEEQARAGDVACALYVGWCYYEGKGVEKDKARALEWLKFASERNSQEAAFRMSLIGIFERNPAVLRDLRTLAEHGYPPALHEMGVTCFAGIFGARDIDEALRWFTLSSERGHLISAIAKSQIEFSRTRGVRKVLVYLKRAPIMFRLLPIYIKNRNDERVLSRWYGLFGNPSLEGESPPLTE